MLNQVSEQITADQETSSDNYATRFSGDIGNWFLEVQSKKVSLCLKSNQISTVLEIGGGHGQLIETYLNLGLKPTIHSSDKICAHRIQKYIDSKKINFSVGDLIILPFPDQSFDAVVSIRLLAHCPAWKQLISEMTRVAKKVVIVDYPPLESFNIFYNLLYNLKAKQEGTTRPFTIFTNKIIRDAFNSCGFVPHKKFPQFFLPMVVYRKIKSVFFAKVIEFISKVFLLTNFFGSPSIASFQRKL